MANAYRDRDIAGGSRHRADEIGVHHRQWWESSGLLIALLAAVALGLLAFWALRRDDSRASVTARETPTMRPEAPMAAAPAAGVMADNQCEQVTILFSSNATAVGMEESESLEYLADCLKQNPEQKVRIEGRADPQESLDRNSSLPEMRAGAVADELDSLGVPRSQITIIRGDANCSADDEACWQQDRSVTVVPLP